MTIENSIATIDWKKCNDLLPVIVQDTTSKEVLMLAYMNQEALEHTLDTGFAHYYSRTKARLWKKGETSGHTQEVVHAAIDCDNDTLLLQVNQEGVACHTGRKSCFFTDIQSGKITQDIKVDTASMYSVIDVLYDTIVAKKGADPKKSYTAQLIKKGENSYLKKIAEESAEFCFAVKDNNTKEIVYEAADMVYHTLVALADHNISPQQIKQELSRRFGMGGLEEKAARTH